MRITTLCLLITACFIYKVHAQKLPKVLVFSKTASYHHESIPAGIAAIQKLGKQHKFVVDTSSNSSLFNDKNLNNYSAILFLSTTGNILDSLQKTSFKKYINNGGGFVGIHSASSTEKSWEWYGKLVGAVFTDHPEPQTGTVIVQDKANSSTQFLPSKWVRKDEWYNFQQLPSDVNVLLLADESSYQGGKHGDYHPIAWYHEFDGGRSFYTALGHFAESYTDQMFLQHLLGGIRYAMKK